MNNYLLVTARTFLCVIVSVVACTILSFFIHTVFGAADYKSDRINMIYALIAGVIGIFIGLVIGIGNLNVITSALTGLLFALIFWAVDVYLMADAGRYEFFSATTRMTFIAFVPPMILAGIIAAALKNLIFNLAGRNL